MGNLFTRGALCASVCALFLVHGCGGRTAQAPATAELPAAAVPTADFRLDAPAPGGVDAALWGKLQAALCEALKQQAKAASALTLPLNEGSRVDDFAIAPDASGQAVASWLYRNPGDYSQNGVVDAADLVPLAMYYAAADGGADWARASVADGNGDGIVGLGDAVAIAQHYGHGIGGYAVQGGWSAEEGGVWWAVGPALFSDSALRPYDGRREFRLAVAAELEHFYRCVPELPGALQPGLPSNARQYFGGVAGPGQWPMAGGDPQRSSFSATPGPTQRRVRPLFDAETGELITGHLGPLLTSEGSVLLTADDTITAYGLDGRKRWSWSVGNYHTLRGAVLGPDGTVYCTTQSSSSDNVYCLGSDGRLRWRASLEHGAAVLLPVDDILYVTNWGQIFCFDHEGKLLGSAPIGSGDWPYLAADGTGGVYAANGIGLYKFTGACIPAWQSALPTDITAAPVVRRDGVVLVPTEAGVYAYNSGGAQLWLGGDLTWSILALAVAHTGVSVMLADSDTADSRNPLTLVVLAENGALLSQVELGFHGVKASLLLDSADNVYINAGDALLCLKTNGMELFESRVGGSYWLGYDCAIGYDGTLYTCQKGWLYCLTDDGQTPAPAPQVAASEGNYSDHIRLTWPAVPSAVSYRVYRDGIVAPLKQVTVPEYDDYGIYDAQPHSYVVHALSLLGKGDPSNTAVGWLHARASGPNSAGDWAQYGHDAQRRFRSGVNGPLQGALRWSRTLEDDKYQDAPVFAGDGTLYISTYDGWIEALSPAGAVEWKLNTFSDVGDLAVGPDGTLYFGTGVTAFRSRPGSPPPAPPPPDPPFWEDEYVDQTACIHGLSPNRIESWRNLPLTWAKPQVVLGTDGLYADLQTASGCKLSLAGAQLHSFALPDFNWSWGSRLTLNPDNKVYLLAAQDWDKLAFVALDTNLSEVWRYDLTEINAGSYPGSVPAIGNDWTIYLAGAIFLYGLPHGELTQQPAGACDYPPAVAGNGRVYLAIDYSTGVAAPGVSYFDGTGFVRAYATTDMVVGNLVIDKAGKVFFLTQTSQWHGMVTASCISEEGFLYWSLELGRSYNSGKLSLGNDGTLYAVADGTLYAIGAP